MLQTANYNAASFSGSSNHAGNDLAVRTPSGVHRLPHVRTDWVASNVEMAASSNSELSMLAAEVAQAAQQATLQYRENNSWVQLELDLWKAVTSTVEKWRRRAPAPALAARPTSSGQPGSRRVLGPVRFQLRHR